jgi:tRNA-splicing ligase RtcB
MIELRGQYSRCKVFNDNVEEAAISQIYGFLNHPAFENLNIRIMPDVHFGAGAVIGFTSTKGSKIIPNVIGVDVACGVLCYSLGNIEIDFQALDTFIRANIPFGNQIRSKTQRHIIDKAYSQVRCRFWPEKSGEFNFALTIVAEETGQTPNYVMNSLGSLGGGNHFIEVNQDETGCKYLTIHSGSRNFGLKIALFHQKIAQQLHSFGDLSYLEGDEADKYHEHSQVAGQFAKLNREIMAQYILEFLKVRNPLERIESVHNYIADDGMIRKGAISAKLGERVIVPWNMRDGSILGTGKGNEDWNCSAPHGAGRIMGRNVAKKTLDLELYKQQMIGIWSSCVNQGTLDESPMAYKKCDEIQALLADTVEVTHQLKPVYNFKATE